MNEKGYAEMEARAAVENPKQAIGDTKLPLWLCSPIAKVHWCLAQFAGLLKYGAWNWRIAGIKSSTYLSAMERHIEAYKSGEEYDPVDGTHHLGNIMACAALLLEAGAADKLIDDRPPSIPYRATVAEGEAIMKRLTELHGHRSPRHYTIADTEACR
jgi:hypothetical protein